MTERGWESVRIDELDRHPVGEQGLQWRPLRRRLGIQAFGTNVYTSTEAGAEIVEPHTEQTYGHEEMYVVLRGHATFVLGGEEVDAPAGTIVFIRDPSVHRTARAVDADTALLAVGGKPGTAYEPSAWESWFLATPLAKEGRTEEALAIVQEEYERHPEDANTLYNLACFEALAGKSDDALEHLKTALERDPDLRKYVAEDSDLHSIRDDPRFPS